MSSGQSTFPVGQRGFVLAATIWLLAAMTLSVGYYALWIDREVARWQAALDDARDTAAMRGQLATLKYLLVTRAREPAGIRDLDEQLIRFDGRGYTGQGDIRFAITDLAALIPVAAGSGRGMELLLLAAGIPRNRVAPLVARLLDYQDPDELLRPNGNESSRGGRVSEPPDRPVSFPLEYLEVDEWRASLSPEQIRFIQAYATVYGPPTVNLNVAPPLVLRTVNWLDERSVARLIAEREQAPFRDFRDLRRRLGLDAGVEIDPLVLTLYPTRFTRLAVWQAGANREYQVNLRVAVGSELAAPWLVDYAGWATPPVWRDAAVRSEEEQ